VLSPAAQDRSLLNLTVSEGIGGNGIDATQRRPYRLGVDASLWFYHALSGREGENHELRLIFFRLARILALPCLVLFVFDGPQRPAHKRGKDINTTKAHWLESGMMKLVDAFGFSARQAPGEAEAELAYLNRVGILDGILSDDVDTFLFGARVVLRNLGDVKQKYAYQRVSIYNASDIETNSAIGLSRSGMILIALLLGGDYDKEGLRGCGIHIAHGLARAGLGEALIRVASLKGTTYKDAMDEWRESVRVELCHNTHGFLHHTQPSLAASIPDSFPDTTLLHLYLHPITTETPGSSLLALPQAVFRSSSQPALSDLASLCELYFGWEFSKQGNDSILKRFHSLIWPGTFLKLLQAHLTESHQGPQNSSQPSIQPLQELAISVGSHRSSPSTDHLSESRITFQPKPLAIATESGFQSTCNIRTGLQDKEQSTKGHIKSEGSDLASEKIRMWVPSCMVNHPHAGLAHHFQPHKHGKKAMKDLKKSSVSNMTLHVRDTSSDIPIEIPTKLV
ncbi:hypothetical protein FRB99_000891, partial [Tulasnella sp. 403]